MEVRMNAHKASPKVYNVMMTLEGFVKESGLDATLYELIKIRASQINGCAYCIDMHTDALRKRGESERRINLTSVWRECPFYSEQEKVALELTEAVTQIADRGVTDELYERARQHFTEKQFIDLIMAINTINAWNRIAISTRMFPGCFDE